MARERRAWLQWLRAEYRGALTVLVVRMAIRVAEEVGSSHLDRRRLWRDHRIRLLPSIESSVKRQNSIDMAERRRSLDSPVNEATGDRMHATKSTCSEEPTYHAHFPQRLPSFVMARPLQDRQAHRSDHRQRGDDEH